MDVSSQLPVPSSQTKTGSDTSAAPLETGNWKPETGNSKLETVRIKVDQFYGPLDLLLHLVKEAEVDITRIALAQVTEQYISFLKAMQSLDLELAGEFLVVASQLLLIKSRTLRPPDAPEDEEEDEGDPSLDLIRKLLEYKIYKDRARALAAMQDDQSRRFSRPAIKLPGEVEEEPLRTMDLWGLVLNYSRVSKSIRLDVSINILYHNVPIEVFVKKILEALQSRRTLSFRDLVGNPDDRGAVIGTFLAILELMKEERVTARQDSDSSEIVVSLV